jgi:hypothetical protein
MRTHIYILLYKYAYMLMPLYIHLSLGGMKDLPDTDSHSFNDYNHCDLTTMLGM